MKKLCACLLSLCLALSLAVLPASALELDDAKQLLQDYYAGEIPPEVLQLDSLDKILETLGDPYTVYMTQEEYTRFLSSVNGESIVGIGVSIQTAFDNGYKIMSILPNSPALEAGIQAGDRIIAVDGTPLTAGTEAGTLIGGDEGTKVTITVVSLSDGQQRDYTLVRRSVIIPIVTYEMVGDAGLIDCTSFGESTVPTVEEALRKLDKDVSIWIVDLRNNPGGSSDAAGGSAGLFVGGATMVYFRDAKDNYNYLYTLPSCPDLTDKPVIVLTSPYSASGSELFAAAARDHAFGIGMGQRTFGKGIAQTIFDEDNTSGMFDGDGLKVTTFRFFSPDGTTNHLVGVLPSILLSMENTPAAALLLSAPAPSRAIDYLKLELAGLTFYIDQKQAMEEDYVDAFTELLEALPPSAVLSKGSGSQTWQVVAPKDLAAELKLDFTQRTFSDLASSPFANEIQTLAAYQLLGGYGDGTFRPDQTVTRAEFCAMVATALNLPANESALNFSDTSPNAWYANSVSAMAARGFIAGYSDHTFRPDSTITYQEMVTILSGVAAWCNMDAYAMAQEELSASDWADYHEYSPWAQAAARNLDALDALVGDQTPTENGTRQVAAGLLCSMMEGIHLLWN